VQDLATCRASGHVNLPLIKDLQTDPISSIVVHLPGLDISHPVRRRTRKMIQEPSLGIRRRVWLWLSSQVVGKVPDEDSLCEYDCRKQECAQDEWAQCERRLNKATGELRPGKR
jgi:hypothetical protein